MKKFLMFTLCAALAIFSAACFKDEGLSPYVSQLRSNIYAAESETLNVQAVYGFREQPFVNDGAVGERVYTLTFRMAGAGSDQGERAVLLSHGGAEYKAVFKLNPVTDVLTAGINIDDFEEDTFDAIITSGSHAETVTFKSIVPKDTMDYTEALKCFEKNQATLYESFKDSEGNYRAEIYARIIVKDNKGYWYLGFATGNNRIKALLLDGTTGEVLAVRDII